MVDFPKIKVTKTTPEYKLVERFLTNPYWEVQQEDLFAPDVTVEYPYAPPGMLQSMITYEFKTHCIWLRNVISNWEVAHEPVILPTTDKNLFWAIREERADMRLADKQGEYKSETVFRIELKDGKIANFREYADSKAYYDVMGVIWPVFYYETDTHDHAPIMRMEKDQVSHFTVEENIQRAINNYINPITGHDEDPESIYAYDMIELTPFAPYDQKLSWQGEKFDIHTEWMFRVVEEWNTWEGSPYYFCEDPSVLIVESYGYGVTAWSGKRGHYTQREMQIVHLDENGKVDHFRIYFNSVNAFASLGQCLPSIPYFNY